MASANGSTVDLAAKARIDVSDDKDEAAEDSEGEGPDFGAPYPCACMISAPTGKLAGLFLFAAGPGGCVAESSCDGLQKLGRGMQAMHQQCHRQLRACEAPFSGQLALCFAPFHRLCTKAHGSSTQSQSSSTQSQSQSSSTQSQSLTAGLWVQAMQQQLPRRLRACWAPL